MESGAAKRTLLTVIIAAITIASIKLFFPSSSELGNKDFDAAGQTIVIIPMVGIPRNFLSAIRKKLESQHKTEVFITPSFGKGKEMLLPNKR